MNEPRAATPKPGEQLPTLSLPVTYLMIVQGAAATLDWYPGHLDPDYAREQGVPSIYLNTMTYHGIVDRFVLAWAGPGARLRKRSIRMVRPVSAGQAAEVSGRVASAADTSDEGGLIDLELEISVGGEVCVSAHASLELGPAQKS